MDEWSEAEEPACPACGVDLERAAADCPECGEQLVSEEVAEMLEERLAAAYEAEMNTTPRWAVVLTGLALGIAVSPLVVYAAVIAVGELPLVALAGLGLAGWLLPAAALSRLPNPSAVLSRGLYLVVGGIGAVVLAVGYDAVSPGSAVVPGRTGLVVAVLALPAMVALLLARRIAGRAARQARGEPGPLHERAGIEPEDDGETADGDR
ncbi:zinc ribbon domain-containing protein [Haloarcula sp. S1CR25-12]|uniref:Zinc ribbon domain-containing protein n=1 Tax=Haloarcula saliterrae TaxID=2950534 RepID=A0ABU2FAK3_9EURY|nr:zinc ribbon domain-containing protein [Haloarcula sp. S1CR25-12]MDS0259305.1 zinc ribbon domain-containing protein [Haloarcula sp. S1CR25-12]